jgi:acyl carrier protein
MWRLRALLTTPSLSRSFAISRTQIEAAILEALRASETVDHAKLSLTATFKEIKLDSLEQVEVMTNIEEKLDVSITDNEALHLKTVPDTITAFIAAAARSQS